MKKISYTKLFKLLLDKNLSKAELREKCGYSTAVATKLNQHKIVSLSVLLTICDKLECDISDICEAVSDIQYIRFGRIKYILGIS